MRALLVLTLTASLDGDNPGFGMSNGDALHIYGWFTASVWFAPIFGGWLADRLIGQRRAVQIGALVIAAGQFTRPGTRTGDSGMKRHVAKAAKTVGIKGSQNSQW